MIDLAIASDRVGDGHASSRLRGFVARGDCCRAERAPGKGWPAVSAFPVKLSADSRARRRTRSGLFSSHVERAGGPGWVKFPWWLCWAARGSGHRAWRACTFSPGCGLRLPARSPSRSSPTPIARPRRRDGRPSWPPRRRASSAARSSTPRSTRTERVARAGATSREALGPARPEARAAHAEGQRDRLSRSELSAEDATG